jgi:hypothetical protein
VTHTSFGKFTVRFKVTCLLGVVSQNNYLLISTTEVEGKGRETRGQRGEVTV